MIPTAARRSAGSFRFIILLGLALLGVRPANAASDVSVTTSATSGGTFSGGNPNVFTPTAATAVANLTTIQTALNASGTVTLNTASAAAGNGDLTLSTAVLKSAGTDSPFNLNATRDLLISTTINRTTGTLPLSLTAGRAITVNAALTTGGGNVTINTVQPFALNAALNAGTGQIFLQTGSLSSAASQTVTASSVSVSAGAIWNQRGTITGALSVAGTVSPAPSGIAGPLQVNGALSLQSTATTVIDIGGNSQGSTYDSITASGAVTVAGVLQLNFLSGFENQIVNSHSFTILSGSSLTGTFTGLPNNSRITLPNELGSLKITYSSTSVVLSDWQPFVRDLTWDPGSADAGTQILSATNTRAGRHYFRLTTQTTDIGAWRSRLTVSSGEADLYLHTGAIPQTTATYTHRSLLTGSDGIVLRPDQYTAGQDWYLVVNATAGAEWSLFSGRAYVQDLGTLAWTDANSNGQYDLGETALPSGSGPVTVPAEGMRFFKTSVPTGTPAWSLWLNGDTRALAVRKSTVPFHSSTSYYDRIQAGRMLVVAPYLTGSTSTYFLSVLGTPGDSVTLDSRIQEVQTLSFNTTTSATTVSAAPYRVYRVQVPVQQIAWDVAVTPSAGDANIAVRRDNAPAEYDNDAFSEVAGTATDSLTLVPDFLTDATWYITVYGTSPYTFTLRNGPPTITPLAFTDTKLNDQTTRAGWRYYALTDVPSQLGSLGWELNLANQVPGTEIAIRRNAVPSRWNYRTNGSTSVSGGSRVDASSTTGFLQRPGHQADIWYVGIYTPAQALGAFTLTSVPLIPTTTAFDTGTQSVSNQEPGRWKYTRIDVPAGVLGWDVRLTGVSGPTPAMVVRRDQLPQTTLTDPPSYIWQPHDSTTFASGNQIAQDVDWTGWSYDTGAPTYSQPRPRLVMGTGRPLEPGTYYVGVYNSSTTTATSYTIDSRGIGSGQTYPVADLAYSGGTVSITNLTPREAKYFKVTIPANTPSWEVSLTPTSGDLLFIVRRGTVPDFGAIESGDAGDASGDLEAKMQKAGPERYVMLPPNGQDYLTLGDYYLAVVSEGQNPGSPSYTIGTGTSSGTLTSVGPLAITNLGTASAAGSTTPVSLAGGQLKAFQFTVPVGTASLEVRLDNRVGNPGMILRTGSRLPNPYVYGPGSGDFANYGIDGGSSRDSSDYNILTVANPTPGTFSLILRAGRDGSNAYPDASANLVVRQKPNTALNFAASQNNGNGGTNTDTRQMIDGEYTIYQITPPATADGQTVTGWILKTDILQGAVSLQIYKNFADPTSGMTVNGGFAVVVSPFLTLGDTWYVRVKATGLTHYTLTSRPVTLERPAWAMPTAFNLTFGDSGTDSGGTPLPGDRGVDLGQGEWHFYAVDVPEGNLGLLRTELQAISGNPDLYIREDGVPTTDHDSNGSANGGSQLYQRQLTGSVTEYGNWVPLDGKSQRQLTPGRWYLGVKAAGASNVRYRLIASTGLVTDLALNGGSATTQTLADNDWRYYRFTVPADAPASWALTFSQQVGDVAMWLRDTVPPGQGTNNDNGLSGSGQVRSWSSDSKNQGPYSNVGHDAAGTYTFTTPPLRPGHTYYAGFRSNSSATFSVSSATTGTVAAPPALAFYGGTLTDIAVPAGGSVTYKIAIPADARRWKHTATASGALDWYLEEGASVDLARLGNVSAHASASTASWPYSQPLYANSWPWLPSATFYLTVRNPSASTRTFSFTLNGKNAATEDEDADGLFDAWELSYFPSIYSYNGASDPDGDGVTNAVEFTDGTVPNDLASALYFLNVTATGGSVARSIVLTKYPRGSAVTLTATPNPGVAFYSWTGSLTSAANPLAVIMTTNVTLVADFGPPLGDAVESPALDWGAGAQRWVSQSASTHDGVDALQSGVIGNSGETWVQATVTGPGTLSFWWKVSSESNYDWLEFHLDGTLQSGRISGSVDWTQKTYTLAAGPHTLRWRYSKDGSGVSGSDAAWLDEVSWTPSDPYLGWAAGFFNAAQIANSAISGKTADPDGDGIPNLLEYALDLAPMMAGTAGLPVAQTTAGNLTLTYKRIRADIAYSVETTATLGNPSSWTTVGVTQGMPAGDGTTTATVPLVSGPRFLRLRVGPVAP